jgi:integrase
MIIRQLVNFAKSRRLVANDPVAGLKLREPKPAPQPCWTPDEVDLILASACPLHQVALTILADTGLRVGELQHLAWDDVDHANNVLHIRAKEGWKPKTGDQRAVPMSERVRSLLERLPHTSTWVLTAPPSAKYPNGDHQVSERRLLKALKVILKKLGLPGHLHTFRHAFISRALTSGIPESVVRAWVGHVDADVIRLYTHIADAASQAAMRRLTASPGQSI